MRFTELEPQFMRYETRPQPQADAGKYLHHVNSLDEAQGIHFLCPICFVKNGGNVGTHLIEVTFSGRGVSDDEGSHNREGKPSRWGVSGTGYSDLSTTPSVLIDPALPACAGWHGYITNGDVTNC
jgi:hypothetical protein